MQNLINFRDIGGIKTQDARTVVEKQFLRSAVVNNLSPSDVDSLLNDYQLKHDIDFRSTGEIESDPDEAIDTVSYKQIDIAGQDESFSAQDFAKLAKVASKIDPNKIMIDTYNRYVTSETGRKGYHDFLMGFIEHPNETTIFHCQDGKDRTGIGAALILYSLNVSQELILADYLKTNEERKAANKVQLAEYEKAGATPAELKILAVILDVDKSYIEAAFKTIESEYGSVDNYLTKGLGLPKDFKEQMINLYTTA